MALVVNFSIFSGVGFVMLGTFEMMNNAIEMYPKTLIIVAIIFVSRLIIPLFQKTGIPRKNAIITTKIIENDPYR